MWGSLECKVGENIYAALFRIEQTNPFHLIAPERNVLFDLKTSCILGKTWNK